MENWKTKGAVFYDAKPKAKNRAEIKKSPREERDPGGIICESQTQKEKSNKWRGGNHSKTREQHFRGLKKDGV